MADPFFLYNVLMVDVSLLFVEADSRPLRVLFLDLNAFFASVEQQERPQLRNRPIGVVPVIADGGCVIAASYEAKRFGVKTGTLVRDARQLCPEIELVEARPSLYVSYHNRVLGAVQDHLPIHKVHSIDEMHFNLMGVERQPAQAMQIALEIKRTIRTRVGEHMRCSIGIAPNSFLAKLATDMQKPDGLVVLQTSDLPSRLHCLDLTDFAGINRKMKTRLNAAGIFTAEQMCAATRQELAAAFGSITGERWWYQLRGYEMSLESRERQSLSHSHVLPPSLKTDEGCRETLLRLIHKAAARLRVEKLWACSMTVGVEGYKRSWSERLSLPPTQDSLTLTERFLEAWENKDFAAPYWVGVSFHDLLPTEQITPSLFDPTMTRSQFSTAVDQVNNRFGKNKVYLAGMEGARNAAPERIAFAKTSLFKEGAGDGDD